MANMSYCMFENTLHDLNDCFAYMKDANISESEKVARKQLIELCTEIASEFGDLDD